MENPVQISSYEILTVTAEQAGVCFEATIDKESVVLRVHDEAHPDKGAHRLNFTRKQWSELLELLRL